jgi:hypothetical protein
MPLLRPRFSLLTILLLITIVGLMLVVWRQWREIGPLRAEVRRLRTEQGHLNIDDPTRIYSIQAETEEDDVWMWRIYIPPDRRFALWHFLGNLPTIPDMLDAGWFESLKRPDGAEALVTPTFKGEMLLEVRRLDVNGRDRLFVRFHNEQGGGSSGRPMPGEKVTRMPLPAAASFGMGNGQREFDADKPFLFTYGLADPSNERKTVLLWIEPYPSPVEKVADSNPPPNPER